MFSRIKGWFLKLPARVAGFGPVALAHLKKHRVFYFGVLTGILFMFIVAALGCAAVNQGNPPQPPPTLGG